MHKVLQMHEMEREEDRCVVVAFEELEDFQDDDDEGPSLRREGGGRDDSIEGFDPENDMEIDDFIVHETRDQRPNQQQRRRRDRKMTAAYQEALHEVTEIFGEAEELVSMYERAQRGNQDDQNEMTGAGFASASQRPGHQRKGLDEYDPEALAIHCLLPEDDEIRRKDIPERFQERSGPDPADFEYDLAAEWIYDRMFGDDFSTPEGKIVVDGIREIDLPSPEDDYFDKSSKVICKGHRVVRSLRNTEQAETWKKNDEAQNELKRSISNVLKHIYRDIEEIPYIATYRKQSCGELLCLAPDEIPDRTTADDYNTHVDEGVHYPPPGAVQVHHVKMKRWRLLWTVYELSLKWRRLRLRIEKRVDAFTESQNECCHDRGAFYAIHKCTEHMADAMTAEDADLADRRFRLVMAALKNKRPQTGMGTDSNFHRYCNFNDMGCRAIVEGMGIRESLEMTVQPTEGDEKPQLICCSQDLNDLATDIMRRNKGAVTVDAVSMGAQHMAAMELASHPLVRDAAKKLYERYTTVTTVPTDLGEKVLDPFHMYGLVKRLVKKPLHTFEGDAFLRIIGAFRNGYMKYTLDIQDSDFKDEILPRMMATVMQIDLGPLRQGWEDFRREVVELLIRKHLFPTIEKLTIQKLCENARASVLDVIAEKVWHFVTRGPFKPELDESNYEKEDAMVRVCACCWGQGGKGHPSTVLVMLDSYGELKDILELKQFSGPVEPVTSTGTNEQLDATQEVDRKEDSRRICEFLMEHKPHVIVVGAAHMACKYLVAHLECLIENFYSEHSRFMISIRGNMDVILLCEMIPAIWENSPAAKTELPDHGAHVRRAVALGRCVIDPLAVMASLRDYADTILSVGYSDLQDFVIKEEKLARMDEMMVTAVNQMGGELNLMANVQWRSHALQFIAGLGRRKAQGLLRILHRNANRIESRADLMAEEQLGEHVLKNCIGFLIVNDSELRGMANLEFDPLDETRIHVQHYSLAKEMAMVAVETREPDAALIDLAEKPHMIRSIDLEWFNKRGMEQGREDLISVLIDIGMELFLPFADRRPAFTRPNEAELLHSLVSDKPGTIMRGQLVEALVQEVMEEEIHCTIVQSNLKGIIKKEDFSSAEDVQSIDLQARVRRGDILPARVMGDAYEADCCVSLSCRPLDLQDDERWEKEHCKDPYYHIKTAEEKEQERLSKEAKQQKHLTTRRIDHPLFKNISKAQCVDILLKSPPGTTILRPSEEGYQYIALSFTAFSGAHGDVYLHRNLQESPKGAVRGVHTKLGLPLTMMVTSTRILKFDDLDEVVPCFVDPYIDRVKTLKMHRKFKDGNGPQVEAHLRHEKAQSGPTSAVYCLGVDYGQAGWYFIASIITVNMRKEYFMIVPEGYYYRKSVFKNLESMIAEFKKHPRPVTAAPAPAVPVRNEPYSGGEHARGPSGGSMGQATNNPPAPHAGSDSNSDSPLHF